MNLVHCLQLHFGSYSSQKPRGHIFLPSLLLILTTWPASLPRKGIILPTLGEGKGTPPGQPTYSPHSSFQGRGGPGLWD